MLHRGSRMTCNDLPMTKTSISEHIQLLNSILSIPLFMTPSENMLLQAGSPKMMEACLLVIVRHGRKT